MSEQKTGELLTGMEDDVRFFRCSLCGGERFRYEESYPTTRTMDDDVTGLDGAAVLAFWSNFEWYDGDDDPGVVCDLCDTPLDWDSSKITIDWT